MSIIVEWDNPEHMILRFIYNGQWTWTEFHESLAQGWTMGATVDHPVDHIYDVSKSGPMPLGALSQFRSLRNRTPTNIGRRALVGAGTLTTAITQAMLKIYPSLNKNFILTSTLDEARAFLAQTETGDSDDRI